VFQYLAQVHPVCHQRGPYEALEGSTPAMGKEETEERQKWPDRIEEVDKKSGLY
jgi:hypothetical protein